MNVVTKPFTGLDAREIVIGMLNSDSKFGFEWKNAFVNKVSFGENNLHPINFILFYIYELNHLFPLLCT